MDKPFLANQPFWLKLIFIDFEQTLGCCQENLPRVMIDKLRWQKWVKRICAISIPWWLWCIKKQNKKKKQQKTLVSSDSIPFFKNVYFLNEIFLLLRVFGLLSSSFLLPDIGLGVRVFANGPGDLGSIPGRVIPKTQKMVLDASLLSTQHYKVWIKGKVEQSRKGVAPSPTHWCSSYRKGSLRVTLDYGRQLYLLLFPQCFGRYVLQPSSGVCWTFKCSYLTWTLSL